MPGALLTVNLFAIAAAAFASSLISRDYGWTPWGGLAIAFSPGILYTVTVDTSEPLGVAAIALALLAWIRGRWGAAAVALVAACLIKEPFVVVPASLALWEAIEWARGRRPSDLGRRAAALAAGPLAFAAWQVYLRATFGELSFSGGREETTLLPFTGWWDTLDKAATLGVGDFGASQFGLAQVPLLVATGGFVLLGVFLALRVRTPFDTLYLFLAVILFSLTWRGLLFPKDLIRHLAVPIAVAPAVFAAALRPPPRPRPSSTGLRGPELDELALARRDGGLDPVEALVDRAPAARDEVDQEREVVDPCVPLCEQVRLETLQPTDRSVREPLHLGEPPRERRGFGAESFAEGRSDCFGQDVLELVRGLPQRLDLDPRPLECGRDVGREDDAFHQPKVPSRPDGQLRARLRPPAGVDRAASGRAARRLAPARLQPRDG